MNSNTIFLARMLLKLYERSHSGKTLAAVVNSENIASVKILNNNGFIHQDSASEELSHLNFYVIIFNEGGNDERIVNRFYKPI